MVTFTVSCPHCNKPDHVVGHGTNRGGTKRCRCLACKKAFTIHPKSRYIDPEKAKLIERALDERMPINAIKRTFGVAWDTIVKIAQKKTLDSARQ